MKKEEKESLTYTLLTLIKDIQKQDSEVCVSHVYVVTIRERIEELKRRLEEGYSLRLREEIQSEIKYAEENTRVEYRKRFETACVDYSRKLRAYHMLMEDPDVRKLVFELRLKGTLQDVPYYPV